MQITESLIPLAPIANVVDPQVEHWTIAVMGAAALLALVRALWLFRATGRPVALMMFLAGGCAILHEPLVNLVGGCWHHANARIVFTAYGRPMPLWLCIAYFFYVGIGLSTIWDVFARGVTVRQAWGLYAAAVVADFLMETTLLHLNVYTYYGHQPLVVAKFPFWWGAVNAAYIMATVATIHRLDPWLRGWRVIGIVPITLLVSASVNAAAGFPSWFVINTDLGWLGTQMGGLLTVGLSIGVVHLAIGAVARRGSTADLSKPRPVLAKAS